MIRSVRPAAVGLLVAFLTAATGCGSEGVGEAKGTVTYNGKPLPAGLVVFTNEADTRMASAYLKPDGTYHATQVPAGAVRVTVKTDEFKNQIDERTVKALQKKGVPIVMPDPGDKGTKYVPIPAKYGDRNQSGLKYEVERNEVNQINIDLAR